MRKNLGIVLTLVFVLCFGSLVFAQNTNSSTATDNTMTTKPGGRRHGRKRAHRRGRRHSRRGGMGGAKKANGNANM